MVKIFENYYQISNTGIPSKERWRFCKEYNIAYFSMITLPKERLKFIHKKFKKNKQKMEKLKKLTWILAKLAIIK